MPTLTIGVLAHVDAGKTSLTERLLFDFGAITTLGSVDAGSTRTDTGAIERRRGITIRSAVASLTVGDLDVTLIDTPGHSDFAAEVERALGVLDAAVLVVSAVEGVQARTRVLMRALRRADVPCVIFLNKIDRSGARPDRVLADIRRLIAPHAIALNAAVDAGTPAARTRGLPVPDAVEVLAEHDDTVLRRLVDGPPMRPDEIRDAVERQFGAARIQPVVAGSALTGQGVEDLGAALRLLRGIAVRAGERVDEPAAGTVFALDRAAGGARTAHVRLFAGRLRARERVTLHRVELDGPRSVSGRITGIAVAGSGASVLTAGNIAAVTGLPARVGDRIGQPPARVLTPVTTPSMETVVRPARPEDTSRLHTALMALSEQDPLIHTAPAPGGGTSVRLHGEVQREVIAEMLRSEHGVDAVFEPLGVVYLERLAGTGAAAQELDTEARPVLWAELGFRVEPAPAGSGVGYRLEVELGGLPLAFHRAIEESVRKTLAEGGVHGWPVVDCVVTVTATRFFPPVTAAGDFRALAHQVLLRALADAGTRVHEPCHDVEVEVPPDTVGPVTALLLGAEGAVRETRQGREYWTISAELPVRRAHEVQQQIAGLTRGEGAWSARPGGDRLVSGRPPRRDRHAGTGRITT
ncbi:elongation factor G [Pseudonocardia sp. TRM90224]|uniref:elongation factor G n=1 Tax=Pseudonocardia sp. TRM90224 TaxID=2812678 RepID=UPI001E47120E|nr:TetM/TetW/TetO/TetS family tetracycline resistance ribosomal protection protein [Pseudonocardia sp. TRM90224]